MTSTLTGNVLEIETRIIELEKRIENLEEKQTVQTFDFGKITFYDLARIVEEHISGKKIRKRD